MLTVTVSQVIGQTPLIKIKSLSEVTGCEIFGKAEFLNPGGSVKDRTALGIIEQAEKEGLLKKGSTIVEGTAGNTGIGLATIAAQKVYHLAKHDGILVGTSAALNVFAAYKYALENKNQNKKIVTILCDSATRYQSKIFNPLFLDEKSLVPQAII